MSDTVTEREAVLRERKAFVRGTRHSVRRVVTDLGGGISRHSTTADADAAELYPLPKVEQPRTLMDKSRRWWRVIDTKLEIALAPTGPWASVLDAEVTSDRAAIWHDLYTTPTEVVEDGGDDA